MSNSIIEVNNLSKSYIISHEGKEKYTALRDVMANRVKKIFSFPQKLKTANTSKEEFWALKDINFTIEQGDRVGIIGRNGAGKSTLLKILSRITEPTTGNIKIKGRVASLLEVGTGFHPELTGRENIFLNGAILGMSRAEIRKHFDAIVDFAEIEKFLDTPVKRYSSGMYVRLAFAVAAHLEPEILVVDEVLAVGDAEFQKKCLGKMEDVSKNEGRTVLFVSHNILAIKSLCTDGILLNNGEVQTAGDIEHVIDGYISVNSLASSKFINSKSGCITVEKIEVSYNDVDGNFDIEKDLVFSISMICDDAKAMINVNLFFNSIEGVLIFATCSKSENIGVGEKRIKCIIPANTLNDNIYNIDLMVVAEGPTVLHNIKEVLTIQGHEGEREGVWMGKFPGLIKPQYFKWNHE